MDSFTITLLSISFLFGVVLALVVDSYTKGMYIPRHWHQALPFVTSLIGFAISNHYPHPHTYDVITIFYMAQLFAIGHEVWIIILSVPYQKYMTWVNTSDVKTATIESPDPMPKVKTYQPFENVVEFPSFNLERRFWIDVLRMFDFDPITQKHVDLTETRWVINKKMFAQKPFANMKLKAEHFGLLYRKSKAKNAKFLVKSREAVALVAAGEPLPEWTPPPLLR